MICFPIKEKKVRNIWPMQWQGRKYHKNSPKISFYFTFLIDSGVQIIFHIYVDRKCGTICLSHTAQLPVLNGRKCSPTFHESSNILFNISYLGYYRNFLYRDMKCWKFCLSHTAQLLVINERKCSPTFRESSIISFNISYRGYY